MGHKVRIIAADFSHLRKNNPSVKKDFEITYVDGIEYQWIKTGRYEGNGVSRAITMFEFCSKISLNAKRIAKEFTPDLIISSSTYPLDTYPAQRIASIASCKYIHEVHDMWPATLYEVGGMSRKNPFVVLMQIAENSAYRHCDRCVSLLPYSEQYMIEHGLKTGKFINIQNGVVVEDWKNYESIPEEHKQFFENNKEKFIVGYFGGHALSNALDCSLDLAKAFIDSGENTVKFVFVGDGVEKKRLMERANQEGLFNVKFLPAVNKRAVPDLLRYFDCSYMTGMSSPLYRFGLCLNKMYDSMMAGIPVICAFDAPDTLVKKYNCGYQCAPENVGEIMKHINELKNMSKKERREIGERGQDAILKHYTFSQLAEEFVNCIN